MACLFKNTIDYEANNAYINLLDYTYSNGTPEKRNKDLDRWEKYLRFKPDIKLKYVYYYDSVQYKSLYKDNPGKTLKQIAEKMAGIFNVDFSQLKTPDEIRKMANLKAEDNQYVITLKYKGKTTFLRLFNDFKIFPAEGEVSAGLKRLLVKAPKIGFLEGQLERSILKDGDRDYSSIIYKYFRYSLVNQGFDVVNLSLDSSSVPSDVTVLVIADPRTSFNPSVLAKINSYIASGEMCLSQENLVNRLF